MSAGGYVGRIGGLAVALGVGTAVLTGYGVAAADTGTGESGSGSSATSSAGSPGARAGTAASSRSGGSTTSSAGGSDSDDSAGAAGGDGGSAAGGDDTDDTSDADADDDLDDSDLDEGGDAGEAEPTDGVDDSDLDDSGTDGSDDDVLDAGADTPAAGAEPSGSGGSAQPDAEEETADAAVNTAPDQEPEADTAADLAVPADRRAEALEWLASPQASAGREAVNPTTSARTLAAAATVAAPDPAPVQTATATPNWILDQITGLLSPFAGGGPLAPPANSPMDWVMAAAARRDFVSGPISVSPVVEFIDGVVYGDVGATDARGNPLIYTLVGGPDQGGKVTLGSDGAFSFLPDLSVVQSAGTERFTVMVSEKTQLVAVLEQIPLLGGFVQPIVLGLQQAPILGELLQPIIGYRAFAPIDVNIGELNPDGDPIAFTTMVTSFDGVQISTNFFPASGLQQGQTATTVLNGPGLGSAGNIDPTSETSVYNLVPGLAPLREAGYNVVTWDPRGEFDSGGILQLDNPFFEGRDVQAIIDWVATRPETELDAPGDPTMGMVGGSYGGGIQLVTAGIDDRIEAIVPVIAWNSLNEALYPTAAFKTAWGSLLALDLLQGGARINGQIYPAVILGDLLGFLTETQQAILASSGPTVLVSQITAPTLIIQGTADGLFTLAQSITNAQLLAEAGTTVNMIWACGGHGVCLDPQNPDQTEMLLDSTLNWLDKYVNDELVPSRPVFEWYDQNGTLHSSDLLPSDPDFYGDPLVTTQDGGFLPIIPLLGGSGPQTISPVPLLVSPALAAEAELALNFDIPAPDTTVDVVGAPEITVTYSGFGTGRHIYGQLVDDTTGRVLGNLVTPIPVILDGRTRTVTIDLEGIAYTMTPDAELTLQLVASATPYENLTSVGWINVGEVTLALPTVAGGGGMAAAEESAQSVVAA
ncbi:MAG: CocE/NonD family hydrolase [Actinomycetota bacterium]|nr:CocE/NonD family hydrolase [Actinomycetota bacterium]